MPLYGNHTVCFCMSFVLILSELQTFYFACNLSDNKQITSNIFALKWAHCFMSTVHVKIEHI